MLKFFVLLLFLSLLPIAAGDMSIVEKYVAIGLENNLALKQKDLSLQEGMAALSEARGFFLPKVSLEARYSRAGGGRDIEFPVGDLLNPVYQTLNGLLQEQRFGTVENVSIPFLREEEHDTKVRAVQPIFNSDIYYNYEIRKGMLDIRDAEKRVFARNLVSEIKIAYFNHLKTLQIKTLLSETQRLLEENLRVSQSLFENQKSTEEVVFRARAELSELAEQQAEANKNVAVSAAYLNFLMNRPLDALLETVDDNSLLFHDLPHLPESINSALSRRDEFTQLNEARRMAGNQAKLARGAFLPDANLVVDYGFQGEKYNFTSDDDYWMASVVVSWNLFNGFSDKARVKQARLSEERIGYQQDEIELQIRFQVRQAHQQMIVAGETLKATRERGTSARRSFHIVEKKYREGISPQIEYLDARTTLTNSEISKIIARYDYQIRYAQLELAAAMYPLSP